MNWLMGREATGETLAAAAALAVEPAQTLRDNAYKVDAARWALELALGEAVGQA